MSADTTEVHRMPDIAKEQADLAKAEQDIQEGETRIAHQMALIDELRRDGHDTREAERLLWTLEQSLDAWKGHRDTIRDILAKSKERRGRSGAGC
jgi:ketosteroid isomerase-like protein